MSCESRELEFSLLVGAGEDIVRRSGKSSGDMMKGDDMICLHKGSHPVLYSDDRFSMVSEARAGLKRRS